LDSGLDAVVVAHGRLLRRRADAHTKSNTDSKSKSNTDSYANAESRRRMQRDSNLDRDCDFYRRATREP
jgi:hypothetical protein